jgi:glycosyltransferase involved in cell wall biosynthesis
LSKQKGFGYLIEAAGYLRNKRNDLLFVVSGEGKLEIELKSKVKDFGVEDSFVFLGFTPDIYPYLKGCDLFVLASLFEGMPNVVMEAMAMEKPVIATDVNGARELMGADSKSPSCKTGLIIPSKDPQAIAAAIEKIIDTPHALEACGRAGRERVETHFTVPIMIDNLEEHLQQKLAEKNGWS